MKSFRKKHQIRLKSEKISRALHEDPRTFVLLTAVRNSVLFDDNINGTHCCVYMAVINGYVLLTKTCHLSVKGKALFSVNGNNYNICIIFSAKYVAQ